MGTYHRPMAERALSLPRLGGAVESIWWQLIRSGQAWVGKAHATPTCRLQRRRLIEETRSARRARPLESEGAARCPAGLGSHAFCALGKIMAPGRGKGDLNVDDGAMRHLPTSHPVRRTTALRRGPPRDAHLSQSCNTGRLVEQALKADLEFSPHLQLRLLPCERHVRDQTRP